MPFVGRMNWMLTELPSGDEVNRSVRTFSPVDVAIISESMASRNALMPSAMAVAEFGGFLREKLLTAPDARRLRKFERAEHRLDTGIDPRI